jgi:hypothetical protein
MHNNLSTTFVVENGDDVRLSVCNCDEQSSSTSHSLSALTCAQWARPAGRYAEDNDDSTRAAAALYVRIAERQKDEAAWQVSYHPLFLAHA